MLRHLKSLIVTVWMLIVKIFLSVLPSKSKKKTQETSTSSDKGWKSTDWEEWGEMTEVKVESTTPTTPDAPLLEEDKPRDLFEDMAPVIHATKKIMLKGPHNQKPTPNLNQFAVDPTFTGASSELLEWSDEESSGGWGEQEDSDLPELLRQSRRAERKKREARDRPQNTNTSASLGLGATRLST